MLMCSGCQRLNMLCFDRQKESAECMVIQRLTHRRRRWQCRQTIWMTGEMCSCVFTTFISSSTVFILMIINSDNQSGKTWNWTCQKIAIGLVKGYRKLKNILESESCSMSDKLSWLDFLPSSYTTNNMQLVGLVLTIFQLNWVAFGPSDPNQMNSHQKEILSKQSVLIPCLTLPRSNPVSMKCDYLT